MEGEREWRGRWDREWESAVLGWGEGVIKAGHGNVQRSIVTEEEEEEWINGIERVWVCVMYGRGRRQ